MVRAASPVVLEAATDHKFYREMADNNVYVEARVTVASAPAGTVPSRRNVALVIFVILEILAGDRVECARDVVSR